MGIEAIRVRPGPAAREWLFARIRSLQSADRLRAITVVVPNHYLGLALRRDLAQRGYANIRFTVLARLAEPIGAPLLAARGLSPLTTVLEEACVREALRCTDALAPFAVHRSAVDALRGLFRDLRELAVSEAQRATWSGQSRMAGAAFRAYDTYRARLAEHGLYDETDLLAAAVEALGGNVGTAAVDVPRVPTRNAASELGAVLVFLPGRWSPGMVALVQALGTAAPAEIAMPSLDDELADREMMRLASALGLSWPDLATVAPALSPARLTVLTAPQPAEEVRAVVRRVIADLEAGVPLNKMAILCRREEPYLTLVRETLDAAGLPWAALAGRPAAGSVVGRGLLGLLRLREHDFARTAVLDWRSTLGSGRRSEPSFAEWNRTSREAGVVRGVAGWVEGLARFNEEIADRLAPERDLSDGHRRFLERQMRTAKAMATIIQGIAESTRPPAELTWDALVSWAARCRREHVPTPSDPTEQEFGVLVDEVLDGLRTAATLEPTTDLATFIDTLEASLEARARPEGRLGVGVVIGDVATALGMSFERVHLVGLGEGVFPASAPADPVFPDGDPLARHEARASDERRAYLSALASADGGAALLSAPSWDAALRQTYAAAWLLETVAGLEGRSVSAAELRALDGRPWLQRVVSPAQGLDTAPVLLDVAEWRIADARRCVEPARLATTSLARRVDLPLGRNLEVHRARWSAELTAFDGHVASAATSRRLANGLAAGAMSSSSIEKWAACPFRYFLDKVLYVEATSIPEQEEEWSVSPLERGSLVHDVLERFFGELRSAGRPTLEERYGAADHQRIEAIALDVFAMHEQAGRGAASLTWTNERGAILADLHTLLARDEQRRLEEKVLPALFEQPFGFGDAPSWPAATVPLARGGEAKLHGYIDRVDLGPDLLAPSRVLVVDYKTGKLAKAPFAKDPIVAGTKVQHAVYARAAGQWQAGKVPPGEALIASEYWLVSATGGFEAIRPPDPERSQERLVEVVGIIDEGLRLGAFPQVPAGESQRPGRSGWDNCMWCDFDRICPTGRDQLWERKRGDPKSALHGRLALPETDE